MISSLDGKRGGLLEARGAYTDYIKPAGRGNCLSFVTKSEQRGSLGKKRWAEKRRIAADLPRRVECPSGLWRTMGHGSYSGPEVLLKHSIVPSERSLVPETCIELSAGALCLKDQVSAS
jgi:hypothetical protein